VPADRRLRPRATETAGEASWWTARATADVAPGFTRDKILAEAPLDPAAPGGLFDRLGRLLDDLAEAIRPS
jgi:hypothetical protein